MSGSKFFVFTVLLIIFTFAQGCVMNSGKPVITSIPSLTMVITATPDPHSITVNRSSNLASCGETNCHSDIKFRLNSTPVVIRTPENGHPDMITGFCGGAACHAQATQVFVNKDVKKPHTITHQNLSCFSCHNSNDILIEQVAGVWQPIDGSSKTDPRMNELICSDCHYSDWKLNSKIIKP